MKIIAEVLPLGWVFFHFICLFSGYLQMDFHHDIISSGSGLTEPFFKMKVNILQLWLILNSRRFLGKIKITKIFIKRSTKKL